MYAAVAEFVAHGQNVIFDHVLSAQAWHYLFEDFRVQPLYLVSVHCAVDALVRRERARGDRTLGLAESQAGRMHEKREYDFAVDTTHSNPSACAEVLVNWLQQNPEPCAFKVMQVEYDIVFKAHK
jgi:chloramphenicol 3-O phosphotransferase